MKRNVMIGAKVSTAAFVLLCGYTAAFAADNGPASFQLPGVGDGVVAPDGKTLIVSCTGKGELVYFDTVADKEVKHVEVEFQPTRLAVQGDTLIAAARGSGQLHLLDVQTGKEKRKVNTGGSAIQGLACNPAKGPVFAANQEGTIFAVDPVSGTSTKTRARGTVLAVDPAGHALYTLTQRAIRDAYVAQRVGRQVQIRQTTTGQFATLIKYEVAGNELRQAGVNDHAVTNGQALAVSPDGRKVAVAGGGGMVSPVDNRRTYDVPVYGTDKLDSLVGQVEVGPYPNNVAFHPVLNLGVAQKSGGELILFKASSLVQLNTLKAPGSQSPGVGATLVTFGGNGAKLIFAAPLGGASSQETNLYFFPLDLTPEQKGELRTSH